MRSDKSGVYHTHPWSWFSVVLRGRYYDIRRGGPWSFSEVRFFNSCRAGAQHRVVLGEEVRAAWTLCFRGPRRCRWQVQDMNNGTVEDEPWTGTENPGRTEYA